MVSICNQSNKALVVHIFHSHDDPFTFIIFMLKFSVLLLLSGNLAQALFSVLVQSKTTRGSTSPECLVDLFSILVPLRIKCCLYLIVITKLKIKK